MNGPFDQDDDSGVFPANDDPMLPFPEDEFNGFCHDNFNSNYDNRPEETGDDWIWNENNG